MSIESPIAITPIVRTTTTTITQLRILSVMVTLGYSASITVLLLDDASQEKERKTIDLTTEEYAGWGEDDQYIIDLVLSKIVL